ncbi:MAG: UDP-3-O-(3-hydroxymyristoyl)glucosamine N-acyltransferase, partial [Gammaproteobacteria bacterium]|nr:UDP-3-O-(3-hydroxymyristoyl)glucosamine N-acyltransferase [Gammaproteobacteria bacterium]
RGGQIVFLTNPLYKKYLATTEAAAVILSETDALEYQGNAVICKNPHFVYAKIATYFSNQSSKEKTGIHPTAVIGANCQIDETAAIGAHCVIGQHVKIAAHVIIGAGCILEDFSEIGEASRLDARVTIYHEVKIGKRVHIKSGAVIGSDGFGFANQKGVWHRVPQLGSVEIGDDVDIGANTSIDRGAVENTVIENGVKLDNLIQIGHNVKIGSHTIVAGCVGIAGSTVIGKNCMIGGASMIVGHITITDNVMVTGGTGVSKSILEPGIYSSGVVGVVPNHEFRKNNARFHRLENLMQRVKSLETAIKAFIERNT